VALYDKEMGRRKEDVQKTKHKEKIKFQIIIHGESQEEQGTKRA
jgi:hypothetical protein